MTSNKVLKYTYADLKFVLDEFKVIRRSVERLNKNTGRRFTIDGHLFGSVGEAIASYLFDIKLNDMQSVSGYDGVIPTGDFVEIKIRATSTGAIVLNDSTLDLIDSGKKIYLVVIAFDYKQFKISSIWSYLLDEKIVQRHVLKNNMISFGRLNKILPQNNMLMLDEEKLKKVNALFS